MARLLGDQRQRQEAKVALFQHASGAHHVAAAHTAAPAVTFAAMPVMAPAAVAARGAAVFVV